MFIFLIYLQHELQNSVCTCVCMCLCAVRLKEQQLVLGCVCLYRGQSDNEAGTTGGVDNLLPAHFITSPSRFSVTECGFVP